MQFPCLKRKNSTEQRSLYLVCVMKAKLYRSVIGLAFLVNVHYAAAQDTRFFRIVGPTATTIASFRSDGTLVWSNAQPGVTYTIQTAASLTRGAKWMDYVQVPTSNSVNTNLIVAFQQRSHMVLLPAGTFVMGSPVSEAERGPGDETQHTVTFSKAFYMGKYLVTQADYLTVMGNNPSFFTAQDWNSNPIPLDLNRPVEQVSWDDATNYCGQLTAQEQAAGRLNAGWVYRLPTESEWEYACRAGTTTAFYSGNSLHSGEANFDGQTEYDASAGDISNQKGISLAYTTAVGSYQPNPWGLYDMDGNVWEWCLDWYGNYPVGTVTDPTGPPTGQNRVARGGDWGYSGRRCRSAYRILGNSSAGQRSSFGFRVVLAAD